MSEELTMLARLDTMDFWSLKCINSGGRHTRGAFRSYECRIVHKHKVYSATAKTMGNAINVAMNKAISGHDKGRLPKLRLVGGTKS